MKWAMPAAFAALCSTTIASPVDTTNLTSTFPNPSSTTATATATTTTTTINSSYTAYDNNTVTIDDTPPLFPKDPYESDAPWKKYKTCLEKARVVNGTFHEDLNSPVSKMPTMCLSTYTLVHRHFYVWIPHNQMIDACNHAGNIKYEVKHCFPTGFRRWYAKSEELCWHHRYGNGMGESMEEHNRKTPNCVTGTRLEFEMYHGQNRCVQNALYSSTSLLHACKDFSKYYNGEICAATSDKYECEKWMHGTTLSDQIVEMPF